jgi:hypothetical protein
MEILVPRKRGFAWFSALLLGASLAGPGLAEAPGRSQTQGDSSGAAGKDAGGGGGGRRQIPRPPMQQVFQLSTRLAPTAPG